MHEIQGHIKKETTHLVYYSEMESSEGKIELKH